jgi:hypothetical protein
MKATAVKLGWHKEERDTVLVKNYFGKQPPGRPNKMRYY